MRPLAVIGMSCRLPGGVDDPAALWSLIERGDRLPLRLAADREPGRAVASVDPSDAEQIPAEPPAAYFDLDDLAGVDVGFFGLAPREAERIDPHQRLMMELAWEAIEDAGLDVDDEQEPIGTFVGQWTSEFDRTVLDGPVGSDLYGMMGSGRHATSGRISYQFGLDGPAITSDTACSSSTVALHQAVSAIHAGDCGVALVGGVNVILESELTVAMARAGMLSADGRCRFGAADPGGFGRAEGGAVVVLKSLDRAEADGDRIHGLLLSSAVTSDGRSGRHLVSPGVEGQRSAIAAAWRRAGITGADLDYIEAHGTGTIGDDVELRALAEAFAGLDDDDGDVDGADQDRAGRGCPVGSVKTNIGHTESASGLFGLIKAILVLANRRIPPGAVVDDGAPPPGGLSPDLRLAFDGEELTADRPLRAGVHCYGISGTNTHMVVASAPEPTLVGPPAGPPHVLPISARSDAALAERAAALADRIESTPEDLAAIASTLTRRPAMAKRAAAVGSDPLEAVAALRALADGVAHPGAVTGASHAVDAVDAVDPADATGGPADGDEAIDRARAFVRGETVARDRGHETVPLPGYPWRRLRCWPERRNVGTTAGPGTVSGTEAAAEPGAMVETEAATGPATMVAAEATAGPGAAVAGRSPAGTVVTVNAGTVEAGMVEAGTPLPIVAARPDERVWDRRWPDGQLSRLLDDPERLSRFATEAAASIDGAGWRCSPTEIDLVPPPTGDAHRSQLILVTGAAPRFELFVGTAHGWTAVATGRLERVDGYPLPEPVARALEELPPDRRRSWLTMRIGEQIAIALNRPPSAAIEPARPLDQLGMTPEHRRRLAPRLVALAADAEVAALADAATVEAIVDGFVAHRSSSPLEPGGPGDDRRSVAELMQALSAAIDGAADQHPLDPRSDVNAR